MTDATVTFRRQQRVIVKPECAHQAPSGVMGRVFVVEKVNPKNLLCQAEDGGRGINYPKDSLMPAPPPGEPLPEIPLGRPYEPAREEYFAAGEVVTLDRAFKDFGTNTPMVVLQDKGTKVNVAPLFGDGDRYVRAAPTGLIKRSPAWLAERLLDRVTA